VDVGVDAPRTVNRSPLCQRRAVYVFFVCVLMSGCVRVEKSAAPTTSAAQATTTVSPAVSAAAVATAAKTNPSRLTSNGWNRQLEPIALTGGTVGTTASISQVLADPRGGFLAVGQVSSPGLERASTWYTEDGSTWTEEPIAGADWVTVTSAAAGPNGVVVLGIKGRLEQPVITGFRRGQTPTFAAISLPSPMTSAFTVGFGAGPAGFVAVTTTSVNDERRLEVYSSTDGSTWRDVDITAADVVNRDFSDLSPGSVPVAVGAKGAVIVLPGSPDEAASLAETASGGADEVSGEATEDSTTTSPKQTNTTSTRRVIMSSDLVTFAPGPSASGPTALDIVNDVFYDGDDLIAHGTVTTNDSALSAVRWKLAPSSTSWKRETMSIAVASEPSVEATTTTTTAASNTAASSTSSPTSSSTEAPAEAASEERTTSTSAPAEASAPDPFEGVPFQVSRVARSGDQWAGVATVIVDETPKSSITLSQDGRKWAFLPQVVPIDFDLLAASDDRILAGSSSGPTWFVTARFGQMTTTPMIGMPGPTPSIESVLPVSIASSTVTLVSTRTVSSRAGAPNRERTAVVVERNGTLVFRDAIDNFLGRHAIGTPLPANAKGSSGGTVADAGADAEDFVVKKPVGPTGAVVAGRTTQQLANQATGKSLQAGRAALAFSDRGLAWTVDTIDLAKLTNGAIPVTASTEAMKVARVGDVTMVLLSIHANLDGPAVGQVLLARQGSGPWAEVEAEADTISDLCQAGSTVYRILRTKEAFFVDATTDGTEWSRAWNGELPPETVMTCSEIAERPIIIATSATGTALATLLTDPSTGAVGFGGWDPLGDPSVVFRWPNVIGPRGAVQIGIPSASRVLVAFEDDDGNLRELPSIGSVSFRQGLQFSPTFLTGDTARVFTYSGGSLYAWSAKLSSLASLFAVEALVAAEVAPPQPVPSEETAVPSEETAVPSDESVVPSAEGEADPVVTPDTTVASGSISE
jgi:hypothetical protein